MSQNLIRMRSPEGGPAVLVALAIASAACGDGLVAPERGLEPVQTDDIAYVAKYERGEGTFRQYGFTLIATFRKMSTDTVYLGRCYPDSPTPMFAVELVDDTSQAGAAYDGIWACVGHDEQFRLQPGEARTDTFHLSGPRLWNGTTGRPYGSLEGTFRLRYYVNVSRGDGGTPAPESSAVSNRFTVRVER